MNPHYFITGATGVVGSAFLKRIAERNTRATLLVRGKNRAEIDPRLDELFSWCELSESATRNMDAVSGDLYASRLGLSETDYSRIVEDCTHIVHCAGNVHMNLPLQEARFQTLAMTNSILDLLTSSARVQKMEYISTVGVSGDTPGLIPETWITHDRAFRNSYEAAKADAETLVREKIEAGFPITVHRPSMVVGDSRTGKNISFQVFYHLCEFLSGDRTRGFIPMANGMHLDIIPSDYVAAVIDWSSRQPHQALPPILHICSGPQGAIPIKKLVPSIRNIFADNGRSLPLLKKVPLPLLKSCLRVARPFIHPKHRRAVAALPFFFAYLKQPQIFSNAETLKLLSADNIELPDPDSYLETVLAYYLSRKRSF